MQHRNLSTQRKRALSPLVLAAALLASSVVSLPVAAENPAAAYSIESTVADLVANPKTKAVLDKHVPGLSESPQLSMVQGMSLQQLSGFPQAGISEENLQAMQRELGQISGK